MILLPWIPVCSKGFCSYCISFWRRAV